MSPQYSHHWKKGFLKNNTEIFSNGNLVGSYLEKYFSQSATGELLGKKYIFQTHGLFRQKTSIRDGHNNKPIGEITYNTLKTTANITLDGKVYQWKNENWNHSRWKLYNNRLQISYRGSSFKGEVVTDIEDPLLILTGFFIANFYWQTVVAIVMVLFIILMASR